MRNRDRAFSEWGTILSQATTTSASRTRHGELPLLYPLIPWSATSTPRVAIFLENSIMLSGMDAQNSSAFVFLSAFAVSLCCTQVAYSQSGPCNLLAREQVSTVFGVSVGAGSPIANTGCSWQSIGPSKIMVTLSMQTEKMFAGAKSSAAPGMTKTPISGIGDEAIFTGVPNFSSLWVRKRTTFPLIRVYGLSVSEAQTKLEALAADVVSKL